MSTEPIILGLLSTKVSASYPISVKEFNLNLTRSLAWLDPGPFAPRRGRARRRREGLDERSPGWQPVRRAWHASGQNTSSNVRRAFFLDLRSRGRHREGDPRNPLPLRGAQPT